MIYFFSVGACQGLPYKEGKNYGDTFLPYHDR